MTPTEWLQEISQELKLRLGDIELIDLSIKEADGWPSFQSGLVLVADMRRGGVTNHSELAIHEEADKRGPPDSVAELLVFTARRWFDKQENRQ